jgi:glycosyltransferase involved in cell wall biosynthesis
MVISNQHSVPAVSVVMPVYNGARTLRHSVDSVLAQTFGDLELIICNDASTDETRKILESIHDVRVRVVHNASNVGEGPTRDRAIESARGMILAVIDADDTWMPERLETLLGEVDPSHETMIFDDIIECHDTPSGMVPWCRLRGKNAFGSKGTGSVEVPIESYVRSKRLLIKPLFPLGWIRQYDIRHGCIYGADTEFFLNLMAHGLPLRYVPKPLYCYRITPGSMTSDADRCRMLRLSLEKALNRFENSPTVQAALRTKITMITREEQYLPFVRKLKKKQIRSAFHMARFRPWFV